MPSAVCIKPTPAHMWSFHFWLQSSKRITLHKYPAYCCTQTLEPYFFTDSISAENRTRETETKKPPFIATEQSPDTNHYKNLINGSLVQGPALGEISQICSEGFREMLCTQTDKLLTEFLHLLHSFILSPTRSSCL